MELDDRWDPDPLPNGNTRNQSHPRLEQKSVRNFETQAHYYNHRQDSSSRETDRSAHSNIYDDVSEEDSSSNEYPVVSHQPQVNQKRVRESAQALSERRKRHQSEHPSGIGRGRTADVEGAMFYNSQIISKSRNKSAGKSGARIPGAQGNLRNGYRTVEDNIPASGKSVARSHSRSRDSYQDQRYMTTEAYNQDFIRKPSILASQNNDEVGRRAKEDVFYNPVNPSILSHGSAGQGRQGSSRIDRELAIAPKSRQRGDNSRAKSVVSRSSYDHDGNLHPDTGNIMSSGSNQRQRQKPHLGSPLWPNHESPISKPLPAHRIQHNVDRSTPINSVPVTQRIPSVRSRKVAPNGTRSATSKPKTYDYGFIDDDDVNDTPLENYLRVKPNVQLKANSPINYMNALPKHSAFQSKSSQVAKQVYQTPPRNSNRAITSGLTIDLVTPESGVSARGSMPYMPPNWTPRTRGPRTTGPIKISTPMKFSLQDGLVDSSPQQLEEDTRQRQAAEGIIRKELNAESEALQKDLFGAVFSENEEEKREREEAKRLEAQRAREEKEKQLAIEAETKRQKAEVKARKEREKKEAEQREKEKEIAAKKAKRDAERHHQSLREEQAAAERRNVANKLLQEKKERDMAIQKALDEQKQAVEKQKKEQDAKMEEMGRSMQQLQAQLKSQTIAALKPARKSTAESGTKQAVDGPTTSITSTTATTSTLVPTDMEIDDGDSLFLPETVEGPAMAFSDQQVSNELAVKDNSTDKNPTVVQSIEQVRAPASMAEIFANTISNPNGDNVTQDRDAEREAIRKQRAEERMAMQNKRARSVPVEPTPNTPGRKARATSKAPSKAVPKKKSAQPLAKSPAKALFSTKLKPLHDPDTFGPREQPENVKAVAENHTAEPPVLKPRPLPLPLPPSLPTISKATTVSTRPETRLITQEERDKIEASRQRIQAEAKARKDALTKKRADAKKDEQEQKRTVEYRKKKEKQLRDQALKDGKEFGEFELETTLEKLMEKRERDKKRRNQRRAEERVSSSDHEPVSNSNVPNAFGMTFPQASFTQASSPQISSCDTASDSNHMDEDDDPETQARREHEARTVESLKALAESRAARRPQISPVEKLAPLFSDDSSDESEEDPDDEETTKALIEHARKNNAAKATENTDESLPEAQTEEEIALERDLEAAFEEELIIEGEIEIAKAQLNPDEYATQIVAPLPDMTSYLQDLSTQRSSTTLANRSTQSAASTQIIQPASAKPQKPVSYKMINVYMVMTQLTLYEHEDEPALKKKFVDIDKANKYAQSIVNEYRSKKYSQQEILERWDQEHKYSCQITHDNNKTTKVFIKGVPMNPKEIDKYDPREVHPRFANQYYMVRYEKVVEQLDPETQEVCITDRIVGFADASKLYTALEMANHAAAEYLLEESKPKEEVEEHHTMFEESLIPDVRSSRDKCIKDETLFCCELDGDTVPWADFKTLEVTVEMATTEGPIN